ncbi:Uncharacterised protein [Salmonella enterica subsp. enterica serovar Bovismorbificans]|uniref:Uncharacterized protein n=1 Tax=Salmonella enterica subsp. enterica serovar Bovismorbificans TaxID=58097 RepID=A0A655BM61_SALET|nr:Uncharacterised protein [Salmonella enterica subsp. enterica serovar Bovismorbificans]
MTAHRAGAEQDAAVLDDGAGMNAVAFAFLLRNGFAGQHGFIKPRFALGNFAIHRHAIAGSEPQQHPGLNVRQRDAFFAVFCHYACGGRGEIE